MSQRPRPLAKRLFRPPSHLQQLRPHQLKRLPLRQVLPHHLLLPHHHPKPPNQLKLVLPHPLLHLRQL